MWERAADHDLVVVATANDSHAELARAAIDHGLAVVVDKPLAPSSAEAQDLVDRAAAAGVPLPVFHNRRWDSDFLTAKRLLADGALGDVHRLESRFERWRPEAPEGAWRFATDRAGGGGVLLDLGTHLVDQAIQLFGPVADVHGDVRSVRGTPADDDVFIALRHTSGQTSHIWASDVAPQPGPRLRLIGSEGAFVVEALDGQEDALGAGRRPDDGAPWGIEPPERWGRIIRGPDATPEPIQPEPGAWPEFYLRLEATLRSKGQLPVNPHDAVEVLHTLEATAEPLRTPHPAPNVRHAPP